MKNNKNLKSMNKKNMEKGEAKMEKFIEDEIKRWVTGIYGKGMWLTLYKGK